MECVRERESQRDREQRREDDDGADEVREAVTAVELKRNRERCNSQR